MSSKCSPSAVARVRIGHSRASTYLSGQACEILLDILSAAPTTNMRSISEPCVRKMFLCTKTTAKKVGSVKAHAWPLPRGPGPAIHTGGQDIRTYATDCIQLRCTAPEALRPRFTLPHI